MKEISPSELDAMVRASFVSPPLLYVSWQKVNDEDLLSFQLIGILRGETNNGSEYPSKESYWSADYPIALNYFPNYGSKIYFNGNNFFLVYRDFGGHIPEVRCRVILPDLIV